MMEYKYGYANDFYKHKNNYKPTIASNNNSNFVISKNYGRFQYIPNKSDNNKKKVYNSFRKNAEQNLKIIKENENNIPGRYAYGVGSKNMDNYIPIKMNGCFDDWYKSKKNGNNKNDGEFQIEGSISEENNNKELVGINAIKKRVNTKSNKSESIKSKKEKNKSEKSESISKAKSSKSSKKSKKEKSEVSSSKKSKKENKDKKNTKNNKEFEKKKKHFKK